MWKGQNVIVDGHNRFSICQKNNILFEIIEQEFASRYEVTAWILENQLDRRNINKNTRAFVIGRRYLVEKNEHGGDRKSIHQNDGLISETAVRIGKRSGVGPATVERYAQYTLAVETIESNTGIDAYDILSNKTKGTLEEIKKLAAMDVESQKSVAHFLFNEGEADLESALKRLKRENTAKILKEAEEKRLQLEEQSKIKRDEEAAKETERLRIEHEARVAQENERLAKEKEEQEKLRLAEIERHKKVAEEKAKDDAERERIRKVQQISLIKMIKLLIVNQLAQNELVGGVLRIRGNARMHLNKKFLCTYIELIFKLPCFF